MGIFDEIRTAAEVLREAGKIEQYKQLLDAQQQLLDMQKNLSDLENENKQLKNELQIKQNIRYEKNAYWMDKDGPFCSNCWDYEKKLIRMPSGEFTDFRVCPHCNKTYQIR
jgi:hypothetical protein